MLLAFPSITSAEFAEACQALVQKAHDNLHGTGWLCVDWYEDEDNIGELRIRRAGYEAAAAASVTSSMDDQEGTIEGLEDDNDNDVVISRNSSSIEKSSPNNRPPVEFSVVLSPTYQVPVLWFNLPSTNSIRLEDLEKIIYPQIVAHEARDVLKQVGVMGGISVANHPISDRPCYFVHPCNTLEALTSISNGEEVDPFGYLLLWIGVVGAALGLHIPTKLLC